MAVGEGAFHFAEVVGRIVGPVLTGHGFAPAASSTSSRVNYRRGGVVVSLAYFVEDLPTPWVAVDIGLAALDNPAQLVGLWRALPDDARAREYPSWRFHDDESLDAVVSRIVNEVLLTFGPPLWDSEADIEDLLAKQMDETESRYLEDRRRADLLRARRSFDEGRFQDAIDGFGMIGTEALSAADRRLLYLARQRLGDPDA